MRPGAYGQYGRNYPPVGISGCTGGLLALHVSVVQRVAVISCITIAYHIHCPENDPGSVHTAH